ncbi:PIN domain-containing protein [Aliifodinibius sp. S!AR15-10]|uniref:PIN domain-containing protein n=1 Tax=Aliifodinibius sp. S!AR15-10 TaxID=2950437 RepID=UPI00285502FE|nr:PIN domain-containing protein [Aliifodinibius sp. S!AR15-10]MDR8391275.1 PIN domain-containing protein [Aliifodinibius sp. S!AR15-10]
MRILIDTDVCLDFITGREPYYIDAKKLFWKVENEDLEGVVSPESFSNMYYVLCRFHSSKKVITQLKALCSIITISTLSASIINDALNSGWQDFEDAIQHFSGVEAQCDAIITRNNTDFTKSTLPVRKPSEILSD